jgi:cytochrome c-type biogenesis protein CcmH/NrfF
MITTLLALLTLVSPAQATDVGTVASNVPVPASPATAPAASDGYLVPGIPPALPPPSPETVQQRAWEIGRMLRCPVCRGQSISESTSEAAVDMLNLTRDLVAAGYDEQQIKDFFVSRYSEWILLEPDTRGLNLLLWLAPGFGVGFGIAMAAWLVLKWRKEPDDVPLPSDAGLLPKDRYEQRLLAELED